MGHGHHQWQWRDGSTPRRGWRWWLRPVPLATASLGISLIAIALIGAGGGAPNAAPPSAATTAIEVGLPTTRVGDALTHRAGHNRGEAGGHSGAASADQFAATPAPQALAAQAHGLAEMGSVDGSRSSNGIAHARHAGVDPDSVTVASLEATPEASPAAPHWETIEVNSGDSLAAIFNRAGLSAGELHRLINTDNRTAALQRIYPGDTVRFRVDDDGLQGLRYEIDRERTLVVTRGDDGFNVAVESRAVETRVKHATGTVTTSLFRAGQDAGLSHGQIMRLMQIFEWQVDFAREVRSGDVFSVAYEAYYIDDQHVRDGPILAARYINRGNPIDAVRYQDPDGNTGYYNLEGENLRKAFIRRPVGDARISSHFNPNRKHPVLGIRRPHLGTDFAAPSGTPIKAAGAGRVVHASRKGGYGRTIIIQHANRYRTLYAHMSRYANGIRVGTHVERGQTIGYVGASGLVTGAHLHYEFLKDGRHRNPMTVELPSGDPVPSEHMDDFVARAGPLVAQLNDMSEEQLALRGDE